MTKFLKERICTFLIHRYMGDYLKTELSTEQLQVELRNGTLCIQNVGLNVEYINNTLEKTGLVSLVEGFIGEISLNVPFTNLLKESTKIMIKGLDLTVTPLKEMNMANTQDLVSSMIGSMCSSSMDLARSVADEELFKDNENGGVEQFASMIDQIISRIKVIFEDTTIRIEHEASELCIGLEARIAKMEFVDEQLEACEQQKQSLETITSQPNSLYTVTDLNKLLHIQGVKLFTDIWAPEKDRCSTSSMNSSVDDLPTPSLDFSMSSSSANFQSCYSHFSSRTARFTSSKYATGRSDISIPPNPIPFAQIFGERHTIRIRIHNTALTSRDGAFNRKVDIEIQLGGSLFFLLTPSQLFLIQEILSKIVPKPVKQGLSTGMNAAGVGGRPMQEEHFQQITGQFHNDRGWSVNPLLSRSPMSQNQTWGGGDIFYELGPRNNPIRRSFADRTMSAGASDMVSVPLDNQIDDLPLESLTLHNADLDSGDTDSLTDRTHHGSSSTLVERKPDVFAFSIKAPSLIGVITHDDPLDQSAIKSASNNTETQTGVACETVVKLAEVAGEFFNKAANLKIGVQSLQEQRKVFDYLYDGDHLRLVSKRLRLKFTSERNGTSDRMDVYGTFNKCDFIESLSEKSVMNGSRGITHVDILNFSDSHNSNHLDLSFRMSSIYDRDNDFSIEITMDHPCKSEIDISIVDRISHLLIPKPFFLNPIEPSEKGAKNDLEPSLALRDIEPIISTESTASYKLNFDCPKWTIDFKIPIADLSESSLDYTIRNLHTEYLNLVIEGAHLELPMFKASEIAKHGCIKLDCTTLSGAFIGEESVLECSKEEMKFLYASSKDSKVGFKLTYDFRNKSLKVANQQPSSSMQKSLYDQGMHGSYFKFKEEDRIEGPFAQSNIFYENSKLLMAGNKHELKSFSENCRILSNVNIEISIPNLHLCLPSHKFYEVVYNRFGNDLALFAPKAPVFKNSIIPAANHLNPLINLDDRDFRECQSFHSNRYDYDNDFEDNGSADRNSTRKNSNEQTSSHDFTLSLNVAKAKILLQSTVVLPESSFLTNLGSEIANAELFLVYGYHGNPDLAYFFITAEKTHVYHRNIFDGLRPYEKNVVLHDFCRREKSDIHVEPLPADELCNAVDDNNLAVSLKIHTYFDVKCNCYRKDIIVALAVRNTLIHFKPFRNPNYFWAQQFADFFNVIDYEVPGYVWPKTMIGLHLHLTSCLFGYDHANIVEGSPLKLRVEIGSCDISSNIVQNMQKYKFLCLLEELKMYLSAKKRLHSVNFDPGSRVSKRTSYVKLLSMGLLHLEIDYALPIEVEEGIFSAPSIEVICKNDLLKLWLCSDSLTTFINMVSEFVESDVFVAMTTTPTNQPPPELIQLVNEANMSASMLSRNTITGDLTEEDEERVMDMMNAAMQENFTSSSSPKLVKSFRRESATSDIFNTTTKIPASRSSNSFSSTNTDDEFIVVDEIPGSGITKPSGEPRTRTLDSSFEIVSSHFDVPEAEAVSESVRLPFNHPPPIVKYEVRDFSILIYLYGGNDFGDSAPEIQSYSQWHTKSESMECRRDESLGGPFRDHTVCVEMRLEKISFLAEVFPSAAPTLSLNMLTVQDVVVYDYVLVSNINKLFYQYTSQFLPRRSFAPLLSIRMVEDQSREGKLKVSLLPIKVNFDQDTLEFLEDFFTYLGNNIHKPNIPLEPGNDTPIMEVPHPTDVPTRPGRSFSMASVDGELAIRMSNLQEAFVEDESDPRMYPNLPKYAPSIGSLDDDDYTPKSNNIDYLFEEEDPTLEDSTYSSKEIKHHNGQETTTDLMKSIMLESKKVEPASNVDAHADDTSTVVGGSTVTQRTSSSTLRAQQMSRETFFKEFIFSPACTIAIDYNGKRVHTKKGALIGLLLGMSSLNKAELTLKELHNPKGVIGYGRCINYAIEEWYNDIGRNQLGMLVGSYGPMSSLKHITLGIRDLFVMPLVEYRKEDGRVVKGIQKGATSFGVSALVATIDAGQRLAALIQGAAELAFDIVTPDPYLQHRRRAFVQRAKVPSDIREGLHMAYDTITEGVQDSSQSLQNALQEDRARGNWPIRGVIRHAFPLSILPIVIASRAAFHALGGLKNQMKPEDRQEEIEKWRYADPNRYMALMSKYHKL